MARTGQRSIVVFAVVALAGAVLLIAAYRLAAPSMNGLKAQGDAIVSVLERHRSDHGSYPVSAIEAGVRLPRTLYGSWRYRVGGEGSWFELSIGDYEGFDPFTLSWSSKRGEWYLDR